MVLLTEPKTPRSSRTSRRAALSSTPSSKSRSKSPRSTRSPAPPKPSPDKSKRAKSSSGPYQYDPGTTPWTLTCASHYNAFLSAHRPALRCVTFLVFSGIRDAGYTAFAYYSAPSMIGPYAYAFQVHQKPIRTKALHVFFMTNLPYLIYLPLIAAPVDVVVHTLQFFWGENMFFFEGGLLFAPYMVLHWFTLFLAYFAIYVRFVPVLWKPYFDFLEATLVLNDKVYARTLNTRRTPATRILHFLVFVALVAATVSALGRAEIVAALAAGARGTGYILMGFLASSTVTLGLGRLLVGMECGKVV